MSYFIPAPSLCLVSSVSTASSDSSSTSISSEEGVDEPPDNFNRADRSPYSPLFLSPYLNPRLFSVLTSSPPKRATQSQPVLPILCQKSSTPSLSSIGRRTKDKIRKSVRFSGSTENVTAEFEEFGREGFGDVVATVWMTWSGEIYDRTPIEPSECLDMPKRDEEKCLWIKAFQRESARKAELAKAKALGSPTSTPTPTSYEEPLPMRCRFVAAASMAREFIGRKRYAENEKEAKNMPASPALSNQMDLPTATEEVVDMQGVTDEMVQEDEDETHDETRTVEDDSEGSDEEVVDKEVDAPFTYAITTVSHENTNERKDTKDIPLSPKGSPDQKEKCKERKARFGMCGMGKWTRNEVYSSCDALGGF